MDQVSDTDTGKGGNLRQKSVSPGQGEGLPRPLSAGLS